MSESAPVKKSKRFRELGSPLYQLALIALSIYVLVALVLETLIVSDPEVRAVMGYVDFVICLVFLADFFVNLYFGGLPYLKRWGWIDFVSSIPMFDPLRWGRLSRVIRVLRFLRAARSIRVLYANVIHDKVESLTLCVLLFSCTVYSISACLILEFERDYDSPINTAEQALWWAFLNIMNAKTSIDTAKSSEGAITALVLNKVGLLIFAYVNAMIIAWLLAKRKSNTAEASGDDV